MPGVPRLSLSDAAALAARLYAIDAIATELPSERDQNLLLRTASGERFILKVANGNEPRDVLEAECAVMRHLASTGLAPRLIPTVDGRDIAEHGPNMLRVISALDGRTLGSTPLHTDALRRNIGRAMGRLDRALASFDHPAFHRAFHWDLANAADVVAANLTLVDDAVLRSHITTIAGHHATHVMPWLASFRRSVIHSDANDYNVLVDETLQQVTGIIDFGDMVVSHTVNDVAIAMAYVALSAEDPLAAAAAVVAGYHQTHPLTERELSALFPLMCMRLCVSACVAAKQQAERPDADYLGISQGPIASTLPALKSSGATGVVRRSRPSSGAMRAAVALSQPTTREACGTGGNPHASRST